MLGERRSRRRRAILRAALPVFVVSSLVVLVAAPASADDTINVPGPLSPREIVVEVDQGASPSAFVLRDGEGRVVPFTGDAVVVSGRAAQVFPPKLSAGTYSLSYPGGEEVFLVGDPVEAGPSERAGTPVLRAIAVVLLILALVLVLLRRRVGARVLVFAVLSAVLGSSALLVSSVRNPVGAAVSAPDPCSALPMWEERVACMSGHVRDFLGVHGVAAAVDRLEFLAARPGGRWATDCHEIAHYLGQISWRETSDVSRLLDAGTLSCSFGYFHGLLESMGTYSDDVSFPVAASELCAGLPGRFPSAVDDGSVRECAHGIGHAAMWRHNEDLSAARPVCVSLPEESWRDECDSGAVMSWVFAREASRNENRPQDAPEPEVAKPVDLCAPPHGSPTRGCVDGALSGTLRAEYEDSLAWCREHPESASACSSSLGRRLVTWEVEGEGDAAPAARRLCLELHESPDARRDCMATMSYMHLHVLREYSRTSEFCRQVGEDFRDGCREGVLRFYETMRRRGDASGGEVPPDVAAELESRGR